MNRRKIAIFTTSFLPRVGGLQYELKWLMDSTDKLLEGDEYKNLKLYFLIPDKKSLKYARLRNIKVRSLDLKPFSKFHFFWNILKLRKALREIKPDILHCQNTGLDGLMIYFNNLISLRNQKYIITSHGEDIAILPEINYGARLNPIINFLERSTLKRADKHITISRAMKEFAFNAGSKRDNIIIIPDGLKPVDKNIDTNAKEQIIRKYNIKKDDFCLLSLSGMRPVKGLTFLIDGFAKAYSKNKHLKLFLACHGPETKKLREQVKRLDLEDNIHFIGFVVGEKKKAYFDVCSMYCNTALFEPFGIALLEAMDYGLIILGSTKGGIKDYIKDGENGILINPRDIKMISKKIIEVYNNKKLQDRLSKNAVLTVKEYYIDNIAKVYLNLYLKKEV